MWTPYTFKQTLDERRAGELRNFLRLLQDIPFVEAPVSSIIRSFLPLPFTNHTELSLVVMFSTYRHSTKNSALLLPWSTISWWSGLDLHTLNRTFPKLGTSFAHAWYRIFGNFFFYCGFVLLDPEIEVACHLLKLGLCLADSCWARVLVALPSSQRLSCLRTPYMPAPRIKKYLRPSVGLASVRVAAALLARDFQWRILFCLWSCYLVQQLRKTEKAEIGIRRMFGPRSSSDPRTDSWRIQFVSDPLTRCPTLSSRGYILPCLHLLGIQSCCIAPRPLSNWWQQHCDLSRNGFSGHLLRGDIQIKSLNPPSPLFERVLLKLQVSHSKHVLFREPCLFLCFSKAGLVARQHVRVTNVTKQTPVAWFYVDTMTEKVKT